MLKFLKGMHNKNAYHVWVSVFWFGCKIGDQELWLMVSGLLQSLKTLGWICLVALLICYACVGKPRSQKWR